MSACERGRNENHNVVVKFPQPLRTRCWAAWRNCWEPLADCCGSYVKVSCYGFLILFFIALFTSYVWIPILMNNCHKAPGIRLNDVTIRSMAVTNATTGSQWQVTSNFNLAMSVWNRNTVGKCFTTYRKMFVHVKYKSHLILQQEVPLGFSLKPERDRVVSVELQADHFQLGRQDLGPVMEAELQSTNIILEFFISTRYLIADRRSRWKRFGCAVIATTPLEGSRFGRMLDKRCESI